jgi:hypothetical protein
MPGAVAEAEAFAGPTNRSPRHKTAKQKTDTPTPGDTPSSAFASAEEMSHASEQLKRKERKKRKKRKERKERKGSGKGATGEEEDALSDEKIIPRAAAEAGAFTGPTNGTPGHKTAMSHPPERQGSHRHKGEQWESRINIEEEDASSDEEMRPGAAAEAGAFTGPILGPSILSEPRGPPSAIDKRPSLIISELEASQGEEELRRRMQELEHSFERMASGVVLGTGSVDNTVGGDHDKNAARCCIS